MNLEQLPAVNAALNSLSALFLIAGYIFIRRKNIAAHRFCLLSAFATSTLFLISYLTYHYHAGTTRFAGTGISRPIYFAILTTHTVLAVVIVPLALVTLSRALKGRFDKHRPLARWTLPIWLYVSITGVVVYFMLYKWFPSG